MVFGGKTLQLWESINFPTDREGVWFLQWMITATSQKSHNRMSRFIFKNYNNHNSEPKTCFTTMQQIQVLVGDWSRVWEERRGREEGVCFPRKYWFKFVTHFCLLFIFILLYFYFLAQLLTFFPSHTHYSVYLAGAPSWAITTRAEAAECAEPWGFPTAVQSFKTHIPGSGENR